ncbi:unnamed protein product [Parascedosporium putredinis]|uniref:Polyprenal reductase n=1 Tax=Parascedosporium putredinis TaxID=1442378 RepID=A0A9P1HA32_9PEZI|nr:unnamed protein product [Parascedosporium putredinis]CAI8000819.1 unnamed protein product [Parascedosporium putredinis]
MASRILDRIPEALHPLLELAPSQYCQAFFGILGGGCIALQIVPPLQDALLGWPVRLLGAAGLLTRVPHSWFAHFYAALLCFQVFWLVQFVTGGRILTAIAEREVLRGKGSGGMELGQVVLAWGMLTMQGARRLYECFVVMKPSASSSMLAVHWVLSFLVYAVLSISIWIEGSDAILHTSMADADLAPPFWTLFPLVAFSMAAPRGSSFNGTLLATLFFVIANLSATAKSTRKWRLVREVEEQRG